MTSIEELFYNRKAKPAALKKFGFKSDGDNYFYSRKILDGQFELRVNVKDDKVTAEVYDLSAEDKYVLHLVESAEGTFVGAIRAEYERVLNEISQSCFENATVFRENSSKAVIAYTRKRYGGKPEFLWQKFPRNAVLRRRDNRKWYAAILTVAREKLGIAGEGDIEILDLRAPKEQMSALVDNKNYFKGYHMNKQTWFTVPLDGRVPDEVLFALIDMSYELAKK